MEIFASIVSTFCCSIKGMLGFDSGSGEEQGWAVHLGLLQVLERPGGQ